MGKKELFMCIVFFYSGWGKGFISYYFGLTLILISFKIFEISSQRRCTFSFHQNKNIFNQQILFLSNQILSFKSTAI